jgi:phosphoribosylanthranilate isomerase
MNHFLPPATKVCGVRRVADAQACALAGVRFAGLNRVATSHRCVSVDACGPLVHALGQVTPVVVYRNQTVAEILRETKQLGVSWVQLHGAETLQEAAELVREGLHVIRALDGSTAPDALLAWQAVADIVLLDSPKPGSGLPWSWSVPPALDAGRVWIAGGLTPETVATALRQSGAAGVDAASGLESNGQLDCDRISEFVRQATNIVGQ